MSHGEWCRLLHKLYLVLLKYSCLRHDVGVMNHTSKTLGEGRRKRTGSERKKDRGGADGGTSDILTPIYQNQNKERERERERDGG